MLLILAGLLGAEAATAQDRRGLTPEQVQANEQVMANKLYETAFETKPIGSNPFDDYEDVIVHNDGSFTLLAPANRISENANANGSYNLLQSADRVVRYNPGGTIEWERPLSGDQLFSLEESSNNGEIVMIKESDGYGNVWIHAIYDENGNEIQFNKEYRDLLDRGSLDLRVSPSGNYFYTKIRTRLTQPRIQLFSPEGAEVDFPFDPLLSVDRERYDYMFEVQIFQDDIAVVRLVELEKGEREHRYGNEIVRSTLNAISIPERKLLFTYDLKTQSSRRKIRSVPFSRIQVRENHIYFLSDGDFYGYHMPTQSEIINLSSPGGYRASDDNQYVLHRGRLNNGRGTYSLINIATGNTIKQYEGRGILESFMVNENGDLLLHTSLSKAGDYSFRLDEVTSYDVNGNIRYKLYGWFSSIETGYIRDSANTFRINSKSNGEEQ